MKGYGTMTAEEKHLNKMELEAYKDYGGINHSMVPGIQNEKPHIGTIMVSDVGTNKPIKNSQKKIEDNYDRMHRYGATHLGSDVANEES